MCSDPAPGYAGDVLHGLSQSVNHCNYRRKPWCWTRSPIMSGKIMKKHPGNHVYLAATTIHQNTEMKTNISYPTCESCHSCASRRDAWFHTELPLVGHFRSGWIKTQVYTCIPNRKTKHPNGPETGPAFWPVLMFSLCCCALKTCELPHVYKQYVAILHRNSSGIHEKRGVYCSGSA